MKLLAKIERNRDCEGRRWIRLTFPVGAKWPFWIPETVLRRNLGPRPYSEGFLTNDKGEKVICYWGSWR